MRRSILILLILFALMLTGCGQKSGYLSRDIYAMSTVISVNLPADEENAEKLIDETEELIYCLEALLSVTNKRSEVSRFNQCKDKTALSPEVLEVMSIALDTAKNTDGAYDPSCLALTELWDINGEGNIPSEAELRAALDKVDYSLLSLEGDSLIKSKPDIMIDLGGVAKGYALQKCVEALSDTEYGMISFGGNVGVWGTKPSGSPWEIGIKDPFDTSDVIGYFTIDSGYVSVSGDYERYFEKDGVRYHHIFDTKNGYPVDNGIHSVAVYTKDGALGDALSTALFVMGYDKALGLYEKEIYDFEALFVTDDGIFMTKGAEMIFTEK